MNLFKRKEKRTSLQSLTVIPMGGPISSSGVAINPNNAFAIPNVYACVRVLCDHFSPLPLHLFKRSGDGGRERVYNHYAYTLLSVAPNPDMTPAEWREVQMSNLSYRGNAYNRIERRNGIPVALWPLNPDRVQVKAEGTEIVYIHTPPQGGVERYPKSDILHFKGLTLDGVNGIDPITANRDILGYSKATQDYGARFFANDARPLGVLEFPGKVEDEVRAAIKNDWVGAQGMGNQHSIALLDAGMTYRAISISPENAQYLETRKFSLIETGAIFRVPPHKLGDLGSANYSNLVEQNQDFINSTLLPVCVKMEQELLKTLIDPEDWGTYYLEHSYNALLKGDPAARFQAYGSLWDRGIVNADEIRAWENLNAQPDGTGKIFWVPLNYAPASEDRGQPTLLSIDPGGATRFDLRTEAPKETRKTSRTKAARKRRGITGGFADVLEDAMRRVIRKEQQDIKAAVKRDLTERSVSTFKDWLTTFASDTEYTERQLKPVYEAFAKALGPGAMDELGKDFELTEDLRGMVDDYVKSFAQLHANRSVGQINSILAGTETSELLDTINQRVDEWVDGREGGTIRARKVGEQQATTFGEKFVKAAFVAAGVTVLVWHTNGSDTCPLCQELDGKTVGIDTPFMASGESFYSDDTSNFDPKGNVMQPPIHGGCLCSVHPG